MYLGCGAVFGTTTKGDAVALPLQTLREICNAVTIPVVAIGGIRTANIRSLSGSGVAGVAVVSGIFAERDIKGATEQLSLLARQIISVR